METIVKILSIHDVTHDVRSYQLEKPEGYEFVPGQATEVSINAPRWKGERRPFTFTSLNEWPHLEFTIKSYRDHDGVTNALGKLRPGDELILRDVWGAISYKGPGVFIAGGAGITPFIAIFRQLNKEGQVAGNQLYFSNKTSKDIILKDEFDKILGPGVHHILSKENDTRFQQGHIDKEFLEKEIRSFKQPFYICGPDRMVQEISGHLAALGANPDAIVFEK